MATNPYFKDYSAEQNLVEDLTIEIIKTMGRDMLYIPRDVLIKNDLFGEGQEVSYTKGVPLEMYIESVSGFEGQGDVISKFGIEVKDNINLVVSKKRFENEIRTRYTDIFRPREGDLIYFPLSKSLFEINFVEHENPFYQLGKLYSYKLSCELFTYNRENIDTGNTDIDTVETERLKAITKVTLSLIGSPGYTYPSKTTFYLGETLYQVLGVVNNASVTLSNATATAIMAKEGYREGNTGYAYLTGISGAFTASVSQTQSIKGAVSGLEYYLFSQEATSDIAIINPVDHTLDGDNEALELQKNENNIFDFTETDPFSEGRY